MNLKLIYILSIFVLLSLSAKGQVGISTKQIANNIIFHVDSKANNSEPPTASEMVDDIIISTDGNLGLNVANPLYRLSIDSEGTWGDQKPALRIRDGNEKDGHILRIQPGGEATWSPSYFKASATGVFPYKGDALSNYLSLWVYQQGFFSTGTVLTLTPGAWLIYVSILPRCDGNVPGAACFNGNNDFEKTLLSVSFADGKIPIKNNVASLTTDFVGNNKKISGIFYKSKTFNVVSGQIVIENNSGASKDYTLVVGDFVNMGSVTNVLLNGLGAGWSQEDCVAAFKFR